MEQRSSESAEFIYDVVIVGAGLSGLHTAWKLAVHRPELNILVLDKAKSSGGRMATRRQDLLKFDHGAQFLRESLESQDLISYLRSYDLVRTSMGSQGPIHYAPSGMTQWTKRLAESFESIGGQKRVQYNFRVSQIYQTKPGWCLSAESGEQTFGKTVILSCPLPQSLDLLSNSGISFDQDLLKIQYASAIVQLVEFSKAWPEPQLFVDQVDTDVFSIGSQKKKGLCQDEAYTIVMTEQWSAEHFSLSDEQLYQVSKIFLENRFPEFQIRNLQVKKWRYSHPTSIWKYPFERVTDSLFMIGDAFGGPSLHGALKSSLSLLECIK